MLREPSAACLQLYLSVPIHAADLPCSWSGVEGSWPVAEAPSEAGQQSPSHTIVTMVQATSDQACTASISHEASINPPGSQPEM